MVEPLVIQMIRIRVRDGAGGPESEQSFSGPIIRIGRGSGNNLIFADGRVSSIHGCLLIEVNKLFYQDLGSTNGSAIVRDAKRTIVPPEQTSGIELRQADEILLGDADNPSSIRIEEISRVPESSVHEATVVADRALGELAAIPETETFHRLLQLLAELRTEADTLSLTQKVLQFMISSLPEANRSECYLKDALGRFAPALAIGPEGSSIVATPPSSSLIKRLQNERKTVLIHDTLMISRPSSSVQALPSRSLLLAPLVCENDIVGAIQVGSRQGGVFGNRDLDLISVLAQQLSGVLSGARLIERLKEAEARLQGECNYLKERIGHQPALDEMVGSSPSIQEVKRQLLAVAPSRTTILIQGQTGVGKELVARAIHENSPRREATFAAVNCSALASGLLESELFGHVRGAFTGAHRDRKGLFEVAHLGTLFLDEIGEMPLELQPKLLRCLEEGTVLPVGSTKPKRVDVRLVAASNRDLEKEVSLGRFRQDLLFRLNVFSLLVPPLSQRREDILPIAKHFLDRFSAEHKRSHPGFSAEAIALMESYDWPGNIRELRNEIERASLLALIGQPVDRIHFSERLTGGQELVPTVDGSLKDTMERLEAVVIQSALKRHQGNRTHCANALGISRQALITKIARFGITED